MTLTAPLRIGVNLCYLRPGVVGGSETYVRELLRAIDTIDCAEVVIFGRHELVGALSGDTRGTFATTRRGPYSPVSRLIDENYTLAGLAAKAGIDVLLSPANFAAPLLPSRVPQVVTVHDFQHDEQPENFATHIRLARQVLFRASFRRVRHVIAISDHTRTAAIAHYRVPPERITTIHEGVRRPPDMSEEEVATTLRSLDIGDRYFFYPAMAAPHKNHLVLLDAYAAHLRSKTAIPFLVFTGKHSPHSNRIRDRIRTLGLTENVRELGFVPRRTLWALLRGATAMLFPSRFEGFGLPILEAMSVGVPVVASSSTSIPEVAGDAARLIPPDDTENWTREMNGIAGDESLRGSLIERGLRRARTFTWERCAQQTVDTLRRAACAR